MKKVTFIGAIATGLFLTYACEQKTNEQKGETVKAAEEVNDSVLNNNNAKKDADFVVKAANGSLLEVEAGKLVEERATTKAAKDFAKHMIEDHSKASKELKEYATKMNITLPDALDADSQDKINKLKEKKGKDFDKDYIKFMVSDHKEDISDFENESKDANDPELRAWVDKTLPTLRHHLQMAEEKDSLLEASSSHKGDKF